MPQLTKKEIQQLILESIQELVADIKKTHSSDDDDKEETRDFRKDPIKIKGKSLLFDDDDKDNESNILELGADLDESGEPVCEGCLVAYMNEHVGMLEEATYKGRKVPIGKPMRGDVKKSKVFVKDPKTGNVKKVNFGDPNMTIKKSNPKRRKSFRARHHCENPGPRTKARYWSCRAWE